MSPGFPRINPQCDSLRIDLCSFLVQLSQVFDVNDVRVRLATFKASMLLLASKCLMMGLA